MMARNKSVLAFDEDLQWDEVRRGVCYNERASSAHARDDSLRMPAAERSMPVSSAPAMICIDGRLDGSGSTHRLTTLQITARSSVRTLVSSGSTSFPISSGCWRYLMACRNVEDQKFRLSSYLNFR